MKQHIKQIWDEQQQFLNKAMRRALKKGHIFKLLDTKDEDMKQFINMNFFYYGTCVALCDENLYVKTNQHLTNNYTWDKQLFGYEEQNKTFE